MITESVPPDATALGFGNHFTNHMSTMSWTKGGWTEPELRPFDNLSLSPATMVLHYGQAVFEGMKAYRHPDGAVRLFRPELNARRMRASARRLAMPEVPEDRFLECLRLLTEADAAAIPTEQGCSLYLRPLMIATEVTLGTRPAEEYLFLVIASPSGPYFPNGYDAITVWVSDGAPRAHPGGTGAAKCAGNYAAGMAVQRRAAAEGADQVVFLDAREGRYLEELGGMNLFLLREDSGGRTLITPSLTDTILQGITRDSIIVLAADLGLHVDERPVTLEEWRLGCADGSITESFACGTAAVVTPIGQVLANGGSFSVGDGTPGPWSTRFREQLLAVQQGTAVDSHGWMRKLP
jgi:branched-chain amino acid aminotransferase